MIKKCMLFGLFILLMATSLAVAGDCVQLIEDSCTSCHSTQRTCDRLGHYESGQWQDLVTRMASYSSQLDMEKQQQVLRCLSTLAKESLTVCKKNKSLRSR